MAGSRRLPLLIIALALLLKSSGSEDSPSTAAVSSVQTETKALSATPEISSSSDPGSSSPGGTSIPQSGSPSTEEVSTAQSSPAPAGSGTASGSPEPHPTTVTHAGSESPSSELTPASDSAPPIPPRTPSSSMPVQGATQTRTSHRNPGVVVAVCVLVSVVIIGSVLLVVRGRHRDTSEFLVLDEDSVNRRPSITLPPPE
ncbi:PREDICTED: endochitinase A-like [Chinchilla lanigera]|uniref:endochitinase A-like n=1 Tax=Chinchilla lanigera TaxID=34839 RepID=UPI000696C1ED|nr:PREDICTED: endochitinase A-like [Chinchilla lanigera]